MARRGSTRDVPYWIRRAIKAVQSDGTTRYLNPTAFGLALDVSPAIGGVQHYRITPTDASEPVVTFVPARVDVVVHGATERIVSREEWAA